MKVILLCDVKKQGKKDDIINVSDGYAKNYLIKNGLAVPYTQTSAKILDDEITLREDKEAKLISKMEELKTNIEKKSLKFLAKTGKDDKLFGSISTKQIKNKLLEFGYDINKKEIILERPISALGFWTAKIVLHKKVIANIKIEVVKE